MGDGAQVRDEASMLQFKSRSSSLAVSNGTRMCKTDTGGKCSLLLGCSNKWGPVQCVMTHCHCLPGFCFKGGVCVSALKKVKANIVPINSNSRSFPNGRPRIAICASGGGNRALSFTTGIFRGLTELGFMSRVDALSSVSGGTWASSIYMFANRTSAQLLGAPTEPNELTLDYLKGEHAEILQAATGSFTNILLNEIAHQTPKNRLWQQAAGRMYLEPFGLNNPVAYLAGSKAAVARIKQQNPGLADADFNVPMPGRPADFIMLGALIASSGNVATPENTVALEMSPDYTGSPFYPNNSRVVFDKSYSLFDKSTTALVGGGLVDSFAFGGSAPFSPAGQSGGREIQVGAPPLPLTLADAIGISSWTYGIELANTVLACSNPSVTYWPVTSSSFPPPEPAMAMHAADGGNYDNAGLIPLLQREAERIVWVASAYMGLNETYPWESFCSGDAAAEEFDPVLAGVIESVVDKYGYGPEVSDAGNFYQNNQVFARSGILSLSCSIWELKKQGKPAVVKFSPTVLTNTWWGIEGGSKVDIILIYLESVLDFNSDLPNETRAEIDAGDKGMFPGFPIYQTMFLNPPEAVGYTAPQVNLLAALGQYDVLQNRELFESFLA